MKILIFIFMIMFLIVAFSILRAYFPIFPENVKISPAHKKEAAIMSIYTYLGNSSIWAYFTIQSNIIVTFSILLIFFKFNKITKHIFMSSLVYITITFLIFWTMLAPGMPWEYPVFTTEQILLHGLNPILAFVVFLMLKKSINLNYKSVVISTMVYPFAYLIMSAILFFTIFHQKVNIYPFIMFTNPFALNLELFFAIHLDGVIIIGIAILFYVISILYTWIAKKALVAELVDAADSKSAE